jgi:hypothetical protein
MIEYTKEYNFGIIGYFSDFDCISYRSLCGRFFISRRIDKSYDNRTVIQRCIGIFIPINFGFKLVIKDK